MTGTENKDLNFGPPKPNVDYSKSKTDVWLHDLENAAMANSNAVIRELELRERLVEEISKPVMASLNELAFSIYKCETSTAFADLSVKKTPVKTSRMLVPENPGWIIKNILREADKPRQTPVTDIIWEANWTHPGSYQHEDLPKDLLPVDYLEFIERGNDGQYLIQKYELFNNLYSMQERANRVLTIDTDGDQKVTQITAHISQPYFPAPENGVELNPRYGKSEQLPGFFDEITRHTGRRSILWIDINFDLEKLIYRIWFYRGSSNQSSLDKPVYEYDPYNNIFEGPYKPVSYDADAFIRHAKAVLSLATPGNC